ncbi:MAG: 50S ribosomal protein L4 [Lachnospiraceae bacterium]|jgi:large subunit ribosomal protein L4|nr:50S ribosomal protein L4 [Lachnospiraceae bacterium]
MITNKVILYDINGCKKCELQPPAFFKTQKISSGLLYEVITNYSNNQRAGTHKVKTRGEVSFSGAKPWKQKGTGRARAGQKNSPLWRKGGIIFGPQPRNYHVNIPQKKRQRALKMALSMQFKNNNILSVQFPDVISYKTKDMLQLIDKLHISNQKVVFLIEQKSINLNLAVRNIKNVIVNYVKHMNTYQTLWADKLVISPQAFNYIIKEK